MKLLSFFVRALLAFCVTYRRRLWAVGSAMAVMAVCLFMAGCASPTWLTDAANIIPLLVSGAGSVLSFIAALTGNAVAADILAEISTWGTKVESGLKNIETLVGEYNAAPGATLLSDIEQAANLVVGDINSLGTIIGIPAALLSKLQEFANLILTQLENWISLIPALKALPAGSKLTISIPMDKKTFKDQFNAIIANPTGNPDVDAALASATKL
jgi:uncharacterized protein YceK